MDNNKRTLARFNAIRVVGAINGSFPVFVEHISDTWLSANYQSARDFGLLQGFNGKGYEIIYHLTTEERKWLNSEDIRRKVMEYQR